MAFSSLLQQLQLWSHFSVFQGRRGPSMQRKGLSLRKQRVEQKGQPGRPCSCPRTQARSLAPPSLLRRQPAWFLGALSQLHAGPGGRWAPAARAGSADLGGLTSERSWLSAWGQASPGTLDPSPHRWRPSSICPFTKLLSRAAPLKSPKTDPKLPRK